MDEARRNTVLALRLYAWNGRLADALRFPLELLEVALSKRIAPGLRDRYKPDWPRNQDFEKHAHPETLRKITTVLTKRGQTVHEAVVTKDMTFGFWVAMLDSRFKENLWRNRIENAFPNLPKRLTSFEEKWMYVEALGRVLLPLRNRIAHHDPIWTHDPSKMQADISEMARICCKDTARWVQHHETVSRVLREKPKSGPQLTMNDRMQSAVHLPGSATVGEALIAMRTSGCCYVLVTRRSPDAAPEKSTVAVTGSLTGDDVAAWIALKAEDGIADLGDPLSLLLPAAPAPVKVSPTSIPEAAAKAILSAAKTGAVRPRIAYSVGGRDTIKSADLGELLHADAVDRPIIG